MSSVQGKIREVYYRIGTASKREFALNLLNIAARGYQTYFAVAVAAGRFVGLQVGVTHLVWLVCSLFYSALYGVVPKGIFARKKWIEEDIRRSKSIAVAVSQIGRGLERKQLTEAELHQIGQGILVAIRSEVEAQVLDTEGIYINATLLVLDPEDGDKLLVKNRANPDRSLNVRYRKDTMLVWESMQRKCVGYEPDFRGDSSKPYRSILVFPILHETSEGATAVGAVSVDSSRRHHFDGLEKRLETKLLPYMTLLKLVLVWPSTATIGGNHAYFSD